jgi:cytochrome o ubiquinol oxidase subunit 3
LVLLLVRMATQSPTTAVVTRFLRLSLYWHFLDLVWVAIFSVVYLGGML